MILCLHFKTDRKNENYQALKKNHIEIMLDVPM